MERTGNNKDKREKGIKASPKPGIALIGNMKVGKTALFSVLSTGDISNIRLPGNMTQIPIAPAKGVTADLFDTPGVFSIFSVNEDERASRNILLPHIIEHDIKGIILVADAKNIKRSLALVLQYAEYGLPMVLAVNMIDEAPHCGVEIDYQKLSDILGIDVRPVIANQGIGVAKLSASLAKMKARQAATVRQRAMALATGSVCLAGLLFVLISGGIAVYSEYTDGGVEPAAVVKSITTSTRGP